MKKLQNVLLDDHALKLSLSTKAITKAEEEQKKSKVLKKRKADEMESTEQQIVESEAALTNKVLVKNLAFETTPDEIRELFTPYGHIRKVRLPKKANSNNHRGFGFVEFVSKEEAKAAFKAL